MSAGRVRPRRLVGTALAVGAGAALAVGWLLGRWRQRRGRDARYAAALAIARRLPKTELHLHLDGSLPFDFIVRRAKARGIECPSTPEALREMVDDAKRTRARRARSNDARAITRVDAGKNWPIFDFMCQLLQSREELEEATYLLASSLRLHYFVWLAEMRYACLRPSRYLRSRLTHLLTRSLARRRATAQLLPGAPYARRSHRGRRRRSCLFRLRAGARRDRHLRRCDSMRPPF